MERQLADCMGQSRTYVATFFSHFGAMMYCRALASRGIDATPMAVPRKVSAACGTCVRYAHDVAVDMEDCELDCVYEESEGGYVCVLRK